MKDAREEDKLVDSSSGGFHSPQEPMGEDDIYLVVEILLFDLDETQVSHNLLRFCYLVMKGKRYLS